MYIPTIVVWKYHSSGQKRTMLKDILGEYTFSCPSETAFLYKVELYLNWNLFIKCNNFSQRMIYFMFSFKKISTSVKTLEKSKFSEMMSNFCKTWRNSCCIWYMKSCCIWYISKQMPFYVVYTRKNILKSRQFICLWPYFFSIFQINIQ